MFRNRHAEDENFALSFLEKSNPHLHNKVDLPRDAKLSPRKPKVAEGG